MQHSVALDDMFMYRFQYNIQVGSKTWVCALCSQDFTRKYSAIRHSRDLHHGQGTILRMIDYVIGRIAGEYSPANPLAYRSEYKQQASISTSFDDKAFSFPVDANVSVAHDSSQPNSSGPPDQRPNTNAVHTSTTLINGFTAKIDGIHGLARTLYGPEKTEAFLKELYGSVIENEGREEILDRCLEKLKNRINMKQACHLLFSTPAKEADKRPPLYGHHVQHLSESSRTKLEKIEALLTVKLKNPVAVYEKIEELIKVCNSTRHHEILDLELQSLGEGQ
ncbi:MAG: hypothetical protein WBX01_07610 [Nitrososphaeraceae archaeon]